MNCKCVSQRLGGYLDGELAGTEMIAVRDHLNRCDACAEEAESLRSLKSSLAFLPACAPPEGLEERLLASVRAQMRPTMSRRRVGFYWGGAVAMAAAAGFLAVWFGALGHSGSDANQVAAITPEEGSFELSRDQAYEAASDSLSGHSILVTASYGDR